MESDEDDGTEALPGAVLPPRRASHSRARFRSCAASTQKSPGQRPKREHQAGVSTMVPRQQKEDARRKRSENRFPAFWCPTNKATRFLAEVPAREKAFLDRGASSSPGTSKSARDESARRLTCQRDRQTAEISVPKGRRVFVAPHNATARSAMRHDGSSEHRFAVSVQPSCHESNGSAFHTMVELASNPDTEPCASLPFHQRYQYYKRYGFAGKGGKTSWAHAVGKQPMDRDFYADLYQARV